MTTFWILALGLCLVAAAFILLPLWLSKSPDTSNRTGLNVAIFEERLMEYQESLQQEEIDQSEFEQLSLELKKNLLTETGAGVDPTGVESDAGRLPVIMALLVPLFALLAYSDVGLSWGAINDLQLAEELKSAQQQQSDRPHDSEAMRDSVEKLAARLENQPDNHEGWFLLAQSYMSMREYEKSAQAFKLLLGKFPQDHGLSSYYAEAVYLADNRQMTGRVNDAIETALGLNPHDITMLEIKAMAAFQAGDLQGSIDQFRKALAAGADNERAELINDAIARIEEDLRAEGKVPTIAAATRPPAAKPQAAAVPGAEVATAGGRRLQVLVEVSDSVAVGASTPVFVFARAVAGPPMPLAVKRMVRGALPTLVQLDESMAMMPGMGLANFDQVQVVARISSSGIANVSPDDYEVVSSNIDMTRDNPVIKLTISQQVKHQQPN